MMDKPFYNRDGITIYCGDCLEIMPQLESPFDAIIADLPYGTTACGWDSIIPLEPLWEEYKRLIKSNSAIALFGSQPFTSKLIMANPEMFRVEWIWKKPKGTNYLNANRDPMKAHENIIIFANGYPTYNPQKRNGKPYRATSGAVGDFVRDKSVGGWETKNNGDRYPLTIIDFNQAKNPVHPTQKPIDLLGYLIRTYTNPGDLILDNTMGSGTTLVAAQIEGRRAVGIDISEEYCQIAVDRLKSPGFLSLLTESVGPLEQLDLLPESESR